MDSRSIILFGILLFFGNVFFVFSQQNKEYSVYQFPQNKIPCIDGNFEDWEMVPDSYGIGLSALKDTKAGKGLNLDPDDFDISVKVGWVKGLNRLYFFIEAYDDSWDFEDPGLRQDIFELVVDADMSGGPFIKQENKNKQFVPINELHFRGHGAHAQNYHIFTPPKDKSWAMIWGNTPWIKEFPYANAVYDYNFEHGESGILKMEFWITPFDFAAYEGIDRSVVSKLKENELIGMSWCVLEFDTDKTTVDAFMNLAHDTRMINDASFLNPFRLMPLEKRHQPALKADWSFIEVDREKRLIRFLDKSVGDIEKYHWDFGDGNYSSERNPVYQYSQTGEWTVKLCVESENGKDCFGKVWDIVTK